MRDLATNNIGRRGNSKIPAKAKVLATLSEYHKETVVNCE